MKRVLTVPALAAALLAGACGEGATDVDTTPSIRFFNAVWNAPDGIGFTVNGQFAAGSALSYGQSSPTCSSAEAGTTTFAIGVANPGGTGLSSAAIASLNDQDIVDGGNYTVLAGGNVVHPSVVLLDNRVPDGVGANQAAVRFVNLAASSEFPFGVVQGTGSSGTVIYSSLAFRGATPFRTVASGSNAYTITYNGQAVVSGADATLDLKAGSVHTVVIVRDPATNQFQLRIVPGCS